jgi:hypothetical protein
MAWEEALGTAEEAREELLEITTTVGLDEVLEDTVLARVTALAVDEAVDEHFPKLGLQPTPHCGKLASMRCCLRRNYTYVGFGTSTPAIPTITISTCPRPDVL